MGRLLFGSIDMLIMWQTVAGKQIQCLGSAADYACGGVCSGGTAPFGGHGAAGGAVSAIVCVWDGGCGDRAARGDAGWAWAGGGSACVASSAVSTSHRRSTSSRNRATCGDLRFPFAARRASFRSRLESTSVNGAQTSADYDCGSCFWNRNTPRGRVFDPRNGISPMCCQPSPRRQSTKLCG